MTKEDKELLLKDLSARLLYEVKVCPIDCGTAILIGVLKDCVLLHDTVLNKDYDKPWDIEYIKPYLRPMSSITDDEIRDLQKITCQFCFSRYDSLAYVGAADDGFCFVSEMEQILSYFNAHHFDYRGLIDKGLALEALEGMYK